MVEEHKKEESRQGGVKLKLHLEAKDEQGNITGVYDNPNDLATNQFAGFINTNLLDTGETIKDTAGTGNAISANSAATSPTIVAGTGTTAAAVTDYALQTPVSGSSGSVGATVGAPSGSGTSGTITITGTITNSSGSNITYSEVGIEITVGGNTYLISHDVFTGLTVSNGGTLAVTYTLTYS